MCITPDDIEDLFRRSYAAFHARDIDSALSLMANGVDWPNACEGGQLQGHEAVRTYWTRQWEAIDPHVEPESVERAPDGSVAVRVRQTVRGHDGSLPSAGHVVHRFHVRDGLIARMDVEPA